MDGLRIGSGRLRPRGGEPPRRRGKSQNCERHQKGDSASAPAGASWRRRIGCGPRRRRLHAPLGEDRRAPRRRIRRIRRHGAILAPYPCGGRRLAAASIPRIRHWPVLQRRIVCAGRLRMLPRLGEAHKCAGSRSRRAGDTKPGSALSSLGLTPNQSEIVHDH
ncbi:Hypothetical protein BN69_2286 [Methylocystis sp. SC2]|nr:Hypothetical protein BN69_2286 [Methylocystis sp. SC2]